VRQPQLPEHRTLLVLVRLHPPQNVVENAYGVTMWGPLLSIRHSARSPIAASGQSAQELARTRRVRQLHESGHRQTRSTHRPGHRQTPPESYSRSNNGANCSCVEPRLPERVCRAAQSSRLRYSAVNIGRNPLLLHLAPCLFTHGPVVLNPPRSSTGAKCRPPLM
jgi:hypothetical protein